MTPRSILAVTDFSMHGDKALDRAALLSADHGAVLTLACLAYPGEAPPSDAATRLAHHALRLSQIHRVDVRAVSRLAHAVEDLLPEVRAVDLVVWGTAPVRNLRSFFLGQPVEALIRNARRPVLVARQSAKRSYRSLLVAVDFSPQDWQPASSRSAASRLQAERLPLRRIRAGTPQQPRGPSMIRRLDRSI